MEKKMTDCIGIQEGDSLGACQEYIESAAIDAINQQDKIMNYVKSSIVKLSDMISVIEMKNFELEEAFSDAEKLSISFFESELQNMMENQYQMIEEVTGMFQTILENQNVASEIIHNLESKLLR